MSTNRFKAYEEVNNVAQAVHLIGLAVVGAVAAAKYVDQKVLKNGQQQTQPAQQPKAQPVTEIERKAAAQ